MRETHEIGVKLCDAHPALVHHLADFRSFLIALFAIMHVLFALAQKLRKRKKDPAFQASSPKNFKGPVLGSAPFFARAPGWPSPTGMPAIAQRRRSRTGPFIPGFAFGAMVFTLRQQGTGRYLDGQADVTSEAYPLGILESFLRHESGFGVRHLVLCSGLSPQSSEASPAGTFLLCDHSRGGYGLSLDYRTLEGGLSDYGSPVMTCGTPSACISFPLLLSVPPGLPEPGQTLQWRDGGHLFSIRLVEGSREEYQIDVVEGPHGPRASSLHRYHYRYDIHRGIINYRAEGDVYRLERASLELRLCRGRLTFDDLRRLRPRLVPDSFHNPTLGDPDG